MELRNGDVELLRVIEREGQPSIRLQNLIAIAQDEFGRDKSQLMTLVRTLKRRQLVAFVRGSRLKITESGITALRTI